MTKRYTIDVDDELDAVLTSLSKEKGRNKADVIRRALTAYEYLTGQTKSAGQKVSITTSDDRVLKDVVLP